MDRDGSAFDKLVPGTMCLSSIVERQLECIGEALGLFGGINAGNVVGIRRHKENSGEDTRGCIDTWGTSSEDNPTPPGRERCRLA